MSLRAGLCARSAIVAVSNAVACLRLLGDQALTAALELVNGDGLDHVPLMRHQHVDTLERATGTFAKLCNLGVVSDIAVCSSLPCPDKRLVLLMESVNLTIQFLKVFIGCGQTVLVFGF